MPELPEVETIKKQLSRVLKNKKIKKLDVRLPKLIKHPLKSFKKIVEGARIIKINRRGKMIFIELSSGYLLVIHLKMSGQLIYQGEQNKPARNASPARHVDASRAGWRSDTSRHTHLIYYFSDGSKLLHNDLRKFGYVKVIAKNELSDFLASQKLGPEPLDKKFSFDVFGESLLARKKLKIKTALLNQTLIAGIGNIYASEILFKANIHPERKVESLDLKELKKLYKSIQSILELALKHKGSSDRDYLNAYGKKGSYMDIAKVYNREGKPCPKCKQKIKRIKTSGRSSYFCPKCQK